MATTTTTTGRRPSYRCSRCGEQKRGHSCIFEQHVGKRQVAVPMVDAATQVEMDAGMTVRAMAAPAPRVVALPEAPATKADGAGLMMMAAGSAPVAPGADVCD